MAQKKAAKKRPKQASPKQAAARVGVLLRGIDNSIGVIERQKQKISDNLKEAATLVTGLSNAVVDAPKAAVTKSPAKKVQKAKKTATKPSTKKAKTSKAKSSNGAKAKKVAKANPLTAKKPPKEGRPLLKDAIRQVVAAAGSPMKSSDIYNQVVDKWGYWSRQSMYNVLKNDGGFQLVASNTYELVANESGQTTSDSETDQFIDQVAPTTGVGQAVSAVQ